MLQLNGGAGAIDLNRLWLRDCHDPLGLLARLLLDNHNLLLLRLLLWWRRRLLLLLLHGRLRPLDLHNLSSSDLHRLSLRQALRRDTPSGIVLN